MINQERQTLKVILTEQGTAISHTIAAASVDLLLVEDYPKLDTLLSVTGKHSNNISAIDIIINDKTVSSYQENSVITASRVMFQTDIRYRSEYNHTVTHLGVVRLYLTNKSEQVISQRVEELVKAMGLIFLFLVISLIFLLQKTILKKIKLLNIQANQLASGDLDSRSHFGGADELTALSSTMNMMASKIQCFQKEVHCQNEELRELDRLKSNFLATTSHELRTPLNGITGLTSSILKGNYGVTPAALVKPLTMVNESGERLLEMVKQLLQYSKVSNTHMADLGVAATKFNIVELFNKALDNLQYSASVKQLHFEKQYLPQLYITTDRNLLFHIIQNLLGNAVKYTEKGRILLHAKKVDESGRQGFLIVVEDTGMGIPIPLQDQVFDHFYQIEGAEARTSEGIGIGLSIVAESIRLLGGKVHLRSELGRGSQFSVIIPTKSNVTELVEPPDDFLIPDRAPSELLPCTEHTPLKVSVPENIERVARPQALSNASKQLMIVDDDDINIEVLKGALNHRYTLIAAVSGPECLDKLTNSKPDLILLDLMMPDMSGFEVLKRMSEKAHARHIPVICVTAMGQPESIKQALALGASDYMTKPINEKVLIARIETQLYRAEQSLLLRSSVKTKHREFLSTISHELLTPMNGIIGMGELLLDTHLTEMQHEYLEDLKTSATALLTSLTDTIVFSELESNNLQLQPSEFDPITVLSEVECHFTQMAQDKGLTFIVTPCDSLEYSLLGDAAQLRQLLFHLVHNGLKFTQQGTVTVSARVSLITSSQASLEFEVTDTGIGIPSESLEAICRPFHQLDNSKSRCFNGLGLGLAISKKLATYMGGEMVFESKLGEGSSVRVKFNLPVVNTVVSITPQNLSASYRSR
ncbi:ATP-binding protein [Vibrio profundum]|uniref:ATP-binding protein n=1 Tax=Vibrio profundum TaxID=2910247 RepID=UPI003D0B5247